MPLEALKSLFEMWEGSSIVVTKKRSEGDYYIIESCVGSIVVFVMSNTSVGLTDWRVYAFIDPMTLFVRGLDLA